jgi:hypothetical protein
MEHPPHGRWSHSAGYHAEVDDLDVILILETERAFLML